MNYLFNNFNVSIDLIKKHEASLRHINTLDETTIQRIWRKPGEEPMENLAPIIYDFQMPMYKKMILRFRNNGRSKIYFWNEIDPCNRQLLLAYFGMIFAENTSLMNFFVWVKNNYHQEMIKTDPGADPINYFFGLTDDKQQEIIEAHDEIYSQMAG